MFIALFGSSLASETETSDYKLSASIDYAYNKLIWILSYLTLSTVLYSILAGYLINLVLIIIIYLKTERKNVQEDDDDDEEYIDEIVVAEIVNDIKSIPVIEANNNEGFEMWINVYRYIDYVIVKNRNSLIYYVMYY